MNVGQTYGDLVVVGIRGAIFTCRCACGRQVDAERCNLVRGKVVSCGCRRYRTSRQDLTNRRFGRLVALHRGGRSKRGSPKWHCVCDCGRPAHIDVHDLLKSHTLSCGCLRAEVSSGKANKIRRYGLDSLTAQKVLLREGANYMPSSDKWFLRAKIRMRDAKKFGIPVEFKSAHEFAAYCKSIAPTHCPVFGKELRFNDKVRSPWSFSIDRVEPAKGYCRGNIQILSDKANMMKQDASREELVRFANWILS